MMSKSHYYFSLQPNPWPILSSMSSFSMVISLILFLKFSFSTLLMLTLLNLFILSLLWWFYYSGEFSLQGFSASNLELGLKFSMLLFISSEVFFFFSFFWSYFHFFLSPSMDIGICWPPLDFLMFDFSNIPLINTLILLSSGVTITISHMYMEKKMKMKSLLFLMSTIILGVIFSMLQLKEYNTSFFGMSDSNFGSIFFLLTGFHGIHVLVGSMFLMVVFYRSFKISLNKKEMLSFELSSWYWHFVDVIWIMLYFLIYYLNN